MRKQMNRACSLLLALWMLAALALPIRAAAGDTFAISSVEDLQRFGKLCALDTWSQGRTVTLTADLDLNGVDFTPIPTFGGTFLGQGHTISGLHLTAPGSVQGLFRYLQPGGVVRDLTVKGTVAPAGTRSTVGGIVGDNAGTLQNCSFQGVVQGKSAVGGVAGQNSVTGEIIGCSALGSVSGESATGGIAGRNVGLLLKCTNGAGVNLTQTEDASDRIGADAGAALEELAAADNETSRLLLEGCSDTGGIAGYSSGVLQSCTNNGPVGYPHVGYNTGGIAGRQSGYLAGCVNNGRILGRKDVGGIVGQAEPYLLVDPGRDVLEQLRRELDTLEALINRVLNDAERTGDSVSAQLSAMGDYAGSAKDSTKELLDRVSDFTDENIGTVNTLTADITGALDKISPALDDLSDVGGQLERLSLHLGDAMDSLGGAVDTGDRVMDDLKDAVGGLRQSSADLTAAVSRLENALEAFHRFLDLGSGISLSDLAAARAELSRAFDALREAGDDLDSALSQLQRALSRSGTLSGQLGDALEELKDASNSSAAIGRLLRQALDTIGRAVDDLTANGPVEFIPLGEDFRQASDGLYDALDSLFDEMEALNDVLQSGNTTLTADLRAINQQCNVVFDLLLDTLSDLADDVEEGLSSVIQDTSEEDIAATREGKVADCSNTGIVEGDRNVGGVVGAMAIELDLDPEDDGADRFSFGSSYETKAILMNCLNHGAVTAKKDCVGGLAGRMDLGTALDCQNYGPVSSTGGSYVGGVAGYADASLRSCYAKNTLSGGSYVGGIAGWASRLRDCCAIPTIEAGEECLGAVAGGIEVGGGLSGNRFVDTGVAGVDGVSYVGRAEPIPFDELSQLPGVPVEFISFTLTLMAEGRQVAQIPFLYGDDLSRISLPAVPEREDSYGVWPDFDTSGLNSDITLEAVYTPWVTLVASNEKVNKLSIALAEGRFTEEAELLVGSGDIAPPKEAGEDLLAETWEVSLLGSGLGPEDAVPLRLLNPTGGDALVWQYENGQWRQVETARNGQYLLLTMTGTQGTFFVQAARGVPWLLPAALGGAAVLAALALLARRRANKAAGAQNRQEEPAAK